MRLSSQDKRLIKAANGRCFYCGFPIFPTVPRNWILIHTHKKFQADHKVPLKRGGTDDDANMVCACWSCNGKKNAFTIDEFRLICGLRSGDLNFVFPLEAKKSVQRDWLCVHSMEFEKSIVLQSCPQSIGRYKHRELIATQWKGPR